MKDYKKVSIVQRIISLFLVIVFSFNSVSVAAETLQDKKKNVQNKITQNKNNLTSVKAQRTGIIKQIQTLEASMASIDKELQNINVELAAVNSQMRQAQKELDEISAKREKHYRLLKIRMRDMYENSTVSYLDLFLKSKSFIELIDSIYTINLILKKDNDVLQSIKKLEAEAEKKKNEIEDKKVQVELLKSKQETKKYAVQSNLDEQEKLKNNLNLAEKNYMNQLAALEEESKAIESLINGKTSSTAVYNGSGFAWPVPGYSRISSPFGYRAGFRLQDGSWNPAQNHSGLDIPAAKGTPIRATSAGKVIVAGWVNGYGYTVMIDHGSNIVSLYGHNSALVVSVGQTVSQGQQIAKCGSTGNSSGNHCHFEIRKNGKAVNPLNYVKQP